MSVLHIETESPKGLLWRLQGGSEGVREKLSVYFLSPALGNFTTNYFCIFLVFLLVFVFEYSQEETDLFPVHKRLSFSHG